MPSITVDEHLPTHPDLTPEQVVKLLELAYEHGLIPDSADRTEGDVQSLVDFVRRVNESCSWAWPS